MLTAAGVGLSIAALVSVLGMLDSFGRSIDRGSAEVSRDEPGRILVRLDTFEAVDGGVVADIVGLDEVAGADIGLRLPATAIGDDGEDAFDLVIDALDPTAAQWTPTVSGDDFAPGTIVLAEKAAADLAVGPGDLVTVRVPAVRGGSVDLVETSLVVAGTHPNPIRPFAFVALATTDGLGFAGTTNFLSVYPTDGVGRTELQTALFGVDGIAVTTSVARIGEAFDEALEAFVGFLVISAGAVLVLALLIAFNATRITVEERRRDHATMLAFGLPVRRIVAVLVKESIVVGVLATVFGVLLGTLVLDWMLRSLATRTLPDFGIALHVAPATVVVAASIGIVAVAVTPLFLVRRLRKMDVPSTLRVME